MAGRAQARTLAVFSVAFGAATLLLGAAGLAELAQTYRVDEIAVAETWQSHRLWLTDLASDKSDRDAKTAAIANRFLLMPIATRQSIVNAMNGGPFWEDIAPTEARRQDVLALEESGVIAALGRAPASGDLWLLAAKLHTLLSGYDGVAARALDTSYLVAPLEGSILRARIVFAVGLGPLLGESQRISLDRDLSTAARSDPGFYVQIRAVLPAEPR